jgi:protein-tyrosine phosphatase
LLGVDDESVAADYALSAEHIDELIDRHRAQAAVRGSTVEVSDALLAAEADVMRVVLAEVRARFGSAEAYLQSHGLELEAITALRASLLEDG